MSALLWRDVEDQSSDQLDLDSVVVVLAERRAQALLDKAQHELDAAIGAADGAVPCLEPGPNLWLSEQSAQRREAVKRCGNCPVIAECGAVAAAMPLQVWGVFGGLDYTRDDQVGATADGDESGRDCRAASLEELRAIAGAVVRGKVGSAARDRRNALLVELGRQRRWKISELAEAAGMSEARVGVVLRRHGVKRSRPKVKPRSRRQLEIAAEVAELDGPILRQLRAICPVPGNSAGDLDRVRRDALMGRLWESDPVFWQFQRIGCVAGLSRQVVAVIIERYRDGKASRRPRGRVAAGRLPQAARIEQYRVELAASTDPRVVRLRELGRQLRYGRDPWLKRERAELAVELWTEDPRFWTGDRLGAALGHGPSRVGGGPARTSPASPREGEPGGPRAGTGPGMVNEDRWRELERREQRSAQLRNKFGLNNSDDAEKITDWLTGTGAIPFTLIVLGLIVYAVITLIAGGA